MLRDPSVQPVPILMYHRIGPRARGTTVPGHYVSVKKFASQLALLQRLGYETLTVNELGKAHRGEIEWPERGLCITFDDGYESFLSHAAPLLCAFNMRATVFAVVDLIGKTNVWDSMNGDVEERLMDRGALFACIREGHEIGSHTLRHARLSVLGDRELKREIHESKHRLERILDTAIESFCYPYGDGAKELRIRKMVGDAGYRVATSTMRGLNGRETDPYQLRRLNIRSDTSLPVFWYKLMRDRRP